MINVLCLRHQITVTQHTYIYVWSGSSDNEDLGIKRNNKAIPLMQIADV